MTRPAANGACPESEFADGGPRAFYVLHLERWWLLDIDQWLVDKTDRRIEVTGL